MISKHPKKNKELIQKLIKNGVTFIDEDNTYIDDNVEIGSGSIIYPNVIIWNNVKIGTNCTIQANTMISNDIDIKNNVFVGPGCLIRQNVQIGNNCSIGPNSEIVRSKLGVGCIMGHKNYVGDAMLLDEVKFGAGAIIANTNWQESFKTMIGYRSLIGVNTVIIAPREIGDDCLIAAGSTITMDVPDNHLAIARAQQVNKPRKK